MIAAAFYNCTGTYAELSSTSWSLVIAVIHHALLRLFNGSQPLYFSVDREVGIFS
jgi:hypothetical protein